MLALSRSSAPLPQRETDEMILGKGHRPLSQAARQYLESRFLVRSGASTRVLGGLLVLVGIVLGAAAMSWT
jgi:hypothetical protein